MHYTIAQAVELNMIDRRQQARLAEGIGPGTRYLPAELIVAGSQPAAAAIV